MNAFELVELNGKIWSHSIHRRTGKVSAAASVVSAEEAEAMVTSGEARWSAATQSQRADRDRSIRAAVKAGVASLDYSAEEIQGAVSCGVVSVSDAMNQDV